ncbi:hypothetical protein FACS1894120_3870 [Clostridia bacterium]|nr:hypothetical protein FACS1894120_3870 [Clostridia bacterium]
MKIKYKSNWPVYIVAFIVASAVVGLFAWNYYSEEIQPKIGGGSGNFSDYRPDGDLDTTFIVMLSESKGVVPAYYMMINYRPRDNVAVVVPLRPNTSLIDGRKIRTIQATYKSGSDDALRRGIRDTFGVDCKYYLKLDRSSFINLIDMFGAVPVNIAHDIGGTSPFRAGSHALDGAQLYDYISYPDYAEGEDYRYVIHGSVITSLINKRAKGLTTSTMQSMFTLISNNADTNFTMDDYTRYQKAFQYTCDTGTDIATTVIPGGGVSDSAADGGTIFTVSPSSVDNIKRQFNTTD